MMFSFVIIRPDGQEVEQAFRTDKTTVGRHEKSDLRLLDSMVSRHHCLLTREEEKFVLKDLESRNGTWINGRKIKNKGHVKHGDVIQIGPFRLIFRERDNEGQIHSHTLEMTQSGTKPFVHKHETEQVVKPIGMISNYLQETSRAQPVRARIRRQRLNRNLLSLYSITEQLVVTRDLDEMLDYLVDKIFEIFSPSQTTIMLKDSGETPIPRKERSAEGKGAVRPISSTIVNRILKDRVAILTDNALEDPRFDMGDSIVIDGIRSVMAAPIWEDRTILGLIYVDSLDVVGGYQSEDLDLLTAVGHQAALALQRWKLTERLREEAIKGAVIQQNLARFHPPPVVQLILQGAADLEVKETLGTIFFCDIVDFTSLCESAEPKQLQAILNTFFRTVNKIVFDEQGTLDKFVGDAAIAIYGAPLPQEDAPIRAIRSALRVRQELALSMKSVAPGLKFQVRYGINTGNIVVGNFGSDERMDYTVLGHAVNMASRICETAEPDQVLIGPETFEEIKNQKLFVFKKIGPRQLKGLKNKIKLYEIKDFL
jgi:adenylate cyclase